MTKQALLIDGLLSIWNGTQRQKKRKEDQEAGFIKTRSHNAQDKNWRLFTNVPTSLYGKRNITLGKKFPSISGNQQTMTPSKSFFLYYDRNIYPLCDFTFLSRLGRAQNYHQKISLMTAQMGGNTSFQRTPNWKSNGNKRILDHTRISQELWKYH